MSQAKERKGEKKSQVEMKNVSLSFVLMWLNLMACGRFTSGQMKMRMKGEDFVWIEREKKNKKGREEILKRSKTAEKTSNED